MSPEDNYPIPHAAMGARADALFNFSVHHEAPLLLTPFKPRSPNHMSEVHQMINYLPFLLPDGLNAMVYYQKRMAEEENSKLHPGSSFH